MRIRCLAVFGIHKYSIHSVYNFIEFITLLYTFLVISFAWCKKYMIWRILFGTFSDILPACTQLGKVTFWGRPQKTPYGLTHMVLYVTLKDIPCWRPEDVLYQRPLDVEVWRPEDVHNVLYLTLRDVPCQRLEDVSCRRYEDVHIWSNL